MSNELQSTNQQNPTWPDVIEGVQRKFNEIASTHKMVTWAEESQFAIQAIQKNDQLAQCQVHTVQNAIINVAAIGLTLNSSLGYAYLVPESVKQNVGGRDVWVKECILRVSFKGLLKIATDSGSIRWAKAEVVKESDTFNYRGPCQMPEHIMNPFSDRGKTVGVYCVAKTSETDILVDIMDAGELMKIRNAAKTKNVWDAWPDEMAKKAIIKRASKQWPKTDRYDRLDLAVAAVNEYEGSEDMRDVTPARNEVATISPGQVKQLEMAIQMAAGTVEGFCQKVADIPSLDQLPAQRFDAAINFLKKRAIANSAPESQESAQ